jgi:hypothetical protein
MRKEIIVSVTIISLAVIIFGYFQYVAKMNVLRYEKADETRREQQKKDNLTDCMSNAYNSYKANWNSKCEVEGLGQDCVLMKYQREDIEQDYNDNKDRCVELYK